MSQSESPLQPSAPLLSKLGSIARHVEEAHGTPSEQSDCRGCGAPAGMPPAGPCIAHGTAYAVADTGLPPCDVMRGDGSIPQPTCQLPMGHDGPHWG